MFGNREHHSDCRRTGKIASYRRRHFACCGRSTGLLRPIRWSSPWCRARQSQMTVRSAGKAVMEAGLAIPLRSPGRSLPAGGAGGTRLRGRAGCRRVRGLPSLAWSRGTRTLRGVLRTLGRKGRGGRGPATPTGRLTKPNTPASSHRPWRCGLRRYPGVPMPAPPFPHPRQPTLSTFSLAVPTLRLIPRSWPGELDSDRSGHLRGAGMLRRALGRLSGFHALTRRCRPLGQAGHRGRTIGCEPEMCPIPSNMPVRAWVSSSSSG